MAAAQLDMEGREVSAATVGPPVSLRVPKPRKKPEPARPEAGPDQIPVPLPREVLLCAPNDSTPPLLLW
uniref:hypothetical protein n=1 Tax=Streptomyces tubercidicus TaxID=47759 RepID=UPI0037DC3E77